MESEDKLMAFGCVVMMLMILLFVSIIKATEGRITAAECERLCGAGNVAKYDTKVCECRAYVWAEADTTTGSGCWATWWKPAGLGKAEAP